MSYKHSLAGKTYNTRATFLTELFTQIEAMGWVLHDDQSGSSYKVYKSNGELGDRIYEYIKIVWSTANNITFEAYYFWNATTHVGVGRAYYNGSITTSESGFQGWIYGSKNLVAVLTKVGSTYYPTMFGHFDKKISTIETSLTANATSGSNVTITVSDTTGFVAGNYYQIVGANGEGRDRIQVSSITDSTHLVIANLPRNYSANSKIGQIPSIFGVFYPLNSFYITCSLNAVGTNTTDNDERLNIATYPLVARDFVNPNERENLYFLTPIIGTEYDLNNNPSSFSCINENYILQAPAGNYEDIFTVNLQDKGTATSGTSTTLVDTSKAWATNAFANKVVVISYGRGAGQIRKIVSNDATSVTVDIAWVTVPDTTSQYQIVNESYRVVNANVYIVAQEGT